MDDGSSPQLLFSLERCLKNVRHFLESAKKIFSKQKVMVFYAVKANSHEKILRAICKEGVGCEILSERELSAAKSYSTLLVVNGHYKSANYLKEAIASNPQMLIVESMEEILRAEKAAKEIGIKQIDIGIRISNSSNGKLGIGEADIPLLPKMQLQHCTLRGLHFHAGWNVRDDKVVESYLRRLRDLHEFFVKNGVHIDTWNFGGSFCEASMDRQQLYKRLLLYKSYLLPQVANIYFEPGRYFVGDCGSLHTQVVEVRNGFYCLDTCTYHYHFSGASPKVTLIPRKFREKDSPEKVVFSGHWPSESDQIVVNNLEYTPRVGDGVIFHNLGAYIDGFKDQFSLGRSLDFDFDTNFEKITTRMNSGDRSTMKRYWDEELDCLHSMPGKKSHRLQFLHGLLILFELNQDYSEDQINKILGRIYLDTALLRRELIVEGLMHRDSAQIYRINSHASGPQSQE